MRQRVLTTVSKVRLPENAAQYSKIQKFKKKLNSAGTSKGWHVFVKKNNKLKRPIGKHTASYGFKSPLKIIPKLPPEERDSNKQIKNVRVSKASWIKPLTGEPGGDFDEVVTEEGASSMNTIQDEALLQKLRENENLLAETDKSSPGKEDASLRNAIQDDAMLEKLRGKDDDSDSDKLITGNSNETDEDQDNYAPGHLSVTKVHQTQDNEDNSALVHEEGRIADGKDRPVEEGDENKQINKDKLVTALSQEDEDDEDDEDEDNEPDDEEEDGRKLNHAIRYKEEQLLHLLNKIGQDENHKTEPLETSDQINQEPTPSFEMKQGQMDALMDRERQLHAMREYSSQMKLKQEMLQLLRLSYENKIAQNTAQYFSPQPWRVPEAGFEAPVFLAPTPPVYQPAAYMVPSASATPLVNTNSQGYTINVDGLKGVFSKEPGFVVRFHSPNSEVTVIKKKNLVIPVNTVIR